MSRVDDELIRTLRRLREPVDQEAVLERLTERRRRRVRMQRLGHAGLAGLVVLGSVGGVYGLLRAFDPGSRAEPRRVQPSADTDQLLYWTKRDDRWSLVRAADGSVVATLDNATISSAISPDGRWLAVAEGLGEGRGAVRLIPIPEGQAQLVDHLPPVNSVAWVGEDEVWLCDGNGAIRSVTVPAAEVRIEAEGVGCVGLSVSRDGNRLAFSTGRGDVAIASRLDPAAGEVAVRGVNLGSPTWSPDGTRVAFHRFHGSASSIDILEAATGQVSTIVAGNGAHNLHPTWSPDGTTIAFEHTPPGGPSHVRLLDVATGSVSPADPSQAGQRLPIWDPSAATDQVFLLSWDPERVRDLMQALLGPATLVVDGGCLYAEQGGKDLLLVWPPGFEFVGGDEGEVVDPAGRLVGRVNQPLPRMGGGVLTVETAQDMMAMTIPPSCRRPGESVWLVGEVEGHSPVDTESPGLGIGVPYRIELYTHCGIDFWTKFDGSYWDAVGHDNSSGNPPPGLGNPVDLGTMTLLSEDEAEYVSDSGMRIRFFRVEKRPAGMVCF